jgi:hypothetical protein
MSSSEIAHLKAESARLKAEIAQLKASVPEHEEKEITWRISEKGGVSIYGLQRFPVTLYKNQWEKIFDKVPQLQAFMQENESKLTTKE